MSELSRRDILQTVMFLSVGSLLSGPSLISAETIASAVANAERGGMIQSFPEIDLTPHERLLFDFNWRFVLGDGSDPGRDLSFGEGFEGGFAKTGAIRPSSIHT